MIFKQEYTASETENILIDKQKAAINKQPQFLTNSYTRATTCETC